jgi:2-hydroxychromene-2-carboxylate isomerase
MNIDFWFEFGSTYSYPAAMRVEKLASQHGIRVNWRPFLERLQCRPGHATTGATA